MGLKRKSKYARARVACRIIKSTREFAIRDSFALPRIKKIVSERERKSRAYPFMCTRARLNIRCAHPKKRRKKEEKRQEKRTKMRHDVNFLRFYGRERYNAGNQAVSEY